MAEPNDASTDQPVYKGSEAPCVYCGQVIDRGADRCPHCRTSYSFAVRKASREVVGDWFYLDARNPSGRGVTFETLIKMIEKGRIRAESVVRGPTTHHDWMYAAETPRLAKYLGLCPHCFAPAKPEDTYCTTCQLNMNERPADARPNTTPDTIQDPFHQPAYEMEQRLADATRAAAQAEPPPPRPAPVGAAAPAPARPPAAKPEVKPSPTAVAAAAALAGSGPADRPSRMAPAAKPSRPKIWIVLILTWATLIPVLLLAYALPIPVVHDALHRVVDGALGRTPDPAPPEPPPEPPPATDPKWLQGKLAEADQAEQKKDYAQAIRIYQAIIEKTGDDSWQQRITTLRKKPEEERQARLTKLRERLEMAENLSAEAQFDDALAVLRNISKEDRSLLAGMGMGVSNMEDTIRAAKDRLVAEQKKKQQLEADLAAAAKLKQEKKPAEALAAYEAIGKAFDARLVAKHVDLAAIVAALKTEVAALPPEPPPEPPKPPEPPPNEAATAIADLLAKAADLEKKEKFAEALTTLEQIKTTYDQKFWPDKLEQRIRQVQAKKEALEFFGMDKP